MDQNTEFCGPHAPIKVVEIPQRREATPEERAHSDRVLYRNFEVTAEQRPDVEKIIRIFERRGYIIDFETAKRAWWRYSVGSCSLYGREMDWQRLPSNSWETFRCVFRFVEEAK